MKTELNDLIDDAIISGDGDIDLMTKTVLTTVLARDDAGELLHDLVSWRIRHRIRSGVRSREKSAFSRFGRGNPSPEPVGGKLKPKSKTGPKPRPAKPEKEVAKFLLDRVFVPGRGYELTWGEMTVPDHEARAAYLETQITGTVATIRRHRRAIELIEAAGVSTLAEVPNLTESALEPEVAA